METISQNMRIDLLYVHPDSQFDTSSGGDRIVTRYSKVSWP